MIHEWTVRELRDAANSYHLSSPLVYSCSILLLMMFNYLFILLLISYISYPTPPFPFFSSTFTFFLFFSYLHLFLLCFFLPPPPLNSSSFFSPSSFDLLLHPFSFPLLLFPVFLLPQCCTIPHIEEGSTMTIPKNYNPIVIAARTDAKPDIQLTDVSTEE